MNEPKLCGRLLSQLFRRSQAGERIDIIDLAQEAGASLFAALKAMDALERAGLADARRLRLTLSGLALAAAFSEPASALQGERAPRRSLPRARHAA
jgi:hypothetical protein